MLEKLLQIAVLSCNEATFLIEKSLHTNLTFKERCKLKIRLMLCKYCAAYDDKAKIIHESLESYLTKKMNQENEDYSVDIEKIKINIKERLRA